MRKVVIVQPIAEPGVQTLVDAGFQVERLQNVELESLKRAVADADAILVRDAAISREVMEAASCLRVVSRHGVGLEKIDLAAAQQLGVCVTNTPLANSVSVAEHVIGLMLALAKNIRTMDRATRDGGFELRHKRYGIELRGKILGIAGLGKVGSRVAGIAQRGLGMKVLAYDPNVSGSMVDPGIEICESWDRLFSEADFLSLNLPLTPQMRGAVGMREFRLMKRGAFLINCSRGQLVNEEALIDALRQGMIAGAGLDVFAQEPPDPDNPLLQFDNVILTPHTAAHTVESMTNMAVHAAEGIIDVLNGRKPAWPVNAVRVAADEEPASAPVPSLILNREELVSHGNQAMREQVLDIIEAGIRAADPGATARRLIRLDDGLLRIGALSVSLAEIERIIVIGAGKASWPIVAALEDILGARISEGVVVVKHGEQRPLRYTEVHPAGHPVPDSASVAGAEKMLRLAESAGPKDLVFLAITGGASALAVLPPEGVELADIRTVTELLLLCGGTIRDINIVRRHLCRLKGGRLARYCKSARVITLTLNTASGGLPWPDMCLPDPSTFQDAIEVLKKWNLWAEAPAAIRLYLEQSRGDAQLETVKSFDGCQPDMLYLADPEVACEAAATRAAELGYTPAILSTRLEGEAKDAGVMLSGIASEIVRRDRPFAAPCALISGGETTTRVEPGSGAGGPNQETALAFAHSFKHDSPVAFACVDTDGTDGPTDVAGAIVDSQSRSRATAQCLDLDALLRKHDSLTAFSALADTIITGHTGVNVMNLRVLLVGTTGRNGGCE